MKSWVFTYLSALLDFWNYFWDDIEQIDLRDPRQVKYYIFRFICQNGLDDGERNKKLAEMLMKKGHLPTSRLPKEILSNPYYGDNHQRIDVAHTIDALLTLGTPPPSDTP